MNQIAQTILAQLGGNKFLAMTGAKHLMYSDKDRFFSFRLPRAAKNGINHVKITLNGSDLYDVTYGKVRGLNYTVVAEVEDVYFDSLRESFEYRTGLATSLGTLNHA